MHDYIHSMSTSDLRFIHTTKNELHCFVDEFDVIAVVSLVDSVAVDSDWTIRAVDNVLETEAVTSVVVEEDPIEGVELA